MSHLLCAVLKRSWGPLSSLKCVLGLFSLSSKLAELGSLCKLSTPLFGVVEHFHAGSWSLDGRTNLMVNFLYLCPETRVRVQKTLIDVSWFGHVYKFETRVKNVVGCCRLPPSFLLIVCASSPISFAPLWANFCCGRMGWPACLRKRMQRNPDGITNSWILIGCLFVTVTYSLILICWVFVTVTFVVEMADFRSSKIHLSSFWSQLRFCKMIAWSKPAVASAAKLFGAYLN